MPRRLRFKTARDNGEFQLHVPVELAGGRAGVLTSSSWPPPQSFSGLAPKANAQIYVLYNYNSTNGMIGEYNFDGSVINATLVSGISYGSCITVSGGLI